MNPLSVFSSIFGVGVVTAGSVGGYFIYEKNSNKTNIYSKIPEELLKNYPFSKYKQPDENDQYFLVNSVIKENSNNQSLFQANNLSAVNKIEDKYDDFTCTTLIKSSSQNDDGICQFFEFIDKEKSKANNPINCPVNIKEFKPISFENFGTEEYKKNFPNKFLLVVKNKNTYKEKNKLVFAELSAVDKTNKSKPLLHINEKFLTEVC